MVKGYFAEPLTGDGYVTEPSAKRHPFRNFSRLRTLEFYLALYRRIIVPGRKVCKSRDYHEEEWHNQGWEVVRILEKRGAVFSVDGLDAVRSVPGPYIIAANHMSMLETAVINAWLGYLTPLSFVLKKGLPDTIVGTFIKQFPYVEVSRKSITEDIRAVFEQGAKILEQGRSLIIFPQSGDKGAREPGYFTPKRFNSLPVKLAARTGCPVVPLALRTDIWGSGKRRFNAYTGWYNPGLPVRFSFAPPIKVEGNTKDAHRRIVEFITAKMGEWDVPVME